MTDGAAQLKIDLGSGLVEVSGPEELVKGVWEQVQDLVVAQLTVSKADGNAGRQRVADGNGKQSTEKRGRSRRTKRAAPAAPAAMPEIDLDGDGSVISLATFMEDKEPKLNHEERITCYVYYLVKVRGLESVSLDLIRQCYRHLGRSAPNISGVLSNARNRSHLLQPGPSGSRSSTLTVAGTKLVELELPERAKKASE